MSGWLLALAMKSVAVLGLAFAYYVVVYRGSQWLGRFIPEGRLKEALFRERGSEHARAQQRPLDEAAVVVRETPDDPPRLGRVGQRLE